MNKQEKSHYIILPGRTHKSVHVPTMMYSYPDLLVAKFIELYGKNWNWANKALLDEHSLSLLKRQFIDFLELLKSGEALDGNEKKINEKELLYFYNEIAKAVESRKDEWLGDSYHGINGTLYRGYNNAVFSDKVMPQNLEKLENCIMEDCYVEIDSFNYQGMPTRKSDVQEHVQGRNIYHWPPIEGVVARFNVNSDRVGFNSSRDPAVSNSKLGIRRVRFRK